MIGKPLWQVFMEEETALKSTRGGRREGSGRKPRDTQQVTLRLSPKTIAALHAKADNLGITLSALVEKKLKRL
jgi:predicted HicB family RNase H-like nuclease